MLAHVTDMVARSRARVLQQYRGMTARWLPFIDALSLSVQQAEDALWAILAQLDATQASGVWLERLGRVVGEERQGLSDADFRLVIAARVLANRSLGRIEDILAVTRKLYPAATFPTLTVTLVEMFPAGFELRLGTLPISTDYLSRVLRLLSSTRAAGVGGSVLYQTVADSAAFTFSSSASPQASATLGFGDSSNFTTGGALVGAARV